MVAYIGGAELDSHSGVRSPRPTTPGPPGPEGSSGLSLCSHGHIKSLLVGASAGELCSEEGQA